jgi:hypothetical protein
VKTNKQPASRQDPQAPRKVLVVNPKASFMFPGTEPPLIYAEVRSLIDCAAGVLPASPATEARVLPASPATEARVLPASPATEVTTLGAAIASRLARGEQPGSTIQWKQFCASVRDECDGWADPEHQRPKRGFSDKTISRVVKKARSGTGQIGQTGFQDLS